MRSTHSLCATLLLITTGVLVAPASAQDPVVPTGARIRVTAPTIFSGRFTGTVVGRSAETWSVQVENADSVVVIPRSAITGLEVSRGTGNRTGRGALVGLVVGFIGGWLYEDSQPNKDIDTRPVMGLLVAVPTTLVGAWVGSTLTVDRWEVVPGLGIRPGPSAGVSVTVSLRVQSRRRNR